MQIATWASQYKIKTIRNYQNYFHFLIFQFYFLVLHFHIKYMKINFRKHHEKSILQWTWYSFEINSVPCGNCITWIRICSNNCNARIEKNLWLRSGMKSNSENSFHSISMLLLLFCSVSIYLFVPFSLLSNMVDTDIRHFVYTNAFSLHLPLFIIATTQMFTLDFIKKRFQVNHHFCFPTTEFQKMKFKKSNSNG